MDMLSSNMFSISNPTPCPTISVKPIYLCYIIENQSFPIINYPIHIPLSKPQACKNMFTTQMWFLLLHLCTQSSLSKNTLQSDVKQQFTSFKTKLFCCVRCSSKSTFNNKNNTTLLFFIYKKLWTPSSLSLNLTPYIFLL